MKEEDGVKLSQTLYARAEKIWPRYLCHPFVTQMADGTLPPEKFRYYMLQDYLYLKDYVKIFAAIIQKADDFEQIRFLSGELADTIGETFRTHIPYIGELLVLVQCLHETFTLLIGRHTYNVGPGVFQVLQQNIHVVNLVRKKSERDILEIKMNRR